MRILQPGQGYFVDETKLHDALLKAGFEFDHNGSIDRATFKNIDGTVRGNNSLGKHELEISHRFVSHDPQRVASDLFNAFKAVIEDVVEVIR